MTDKAVAQANPPTGWNILRVVSWVVYALLIVAVGFAGWLAVVNWPFIHV